MLESTLVLGPILFYTAAMSFANVTQVATRAPKPPRQGCPDNAGASARGREYLGQSTLSV